LKKIKVNQKSKGKRQEILLKTVLVIGFVTMCLVFVIIIVGTIMGEKYTHLMESICYFDLALCCISGTTFIILIFCLKPEPSKKVKVMKHKLAPITDVQKFIGTFQAGVLESGYSSHGCIYQDDSFTMEVYTKDGLSTYECLALVRTAELTEGIQGKADDAFGGFLDGSKIGFKAISLIAIFCVDKPNAVLQKFVCENNDQNFDAYKFSAGIILSEDEVYMADIKDAPGIVQFRKLKKQFLILIDPLLHH